MGTLTPTQNGQPIGDGVFDPYSYQKFEQQDAQTS